MSKTIDYKITTSIPSEYTGEFYTSQTWRTLFATDASIYREMPVAVAFPKNENDIRILIEFANSQNIPLIPRTAGTSLAGQVVGNGIVVDVSKYLTKIIEKDANAKWVRVQPGVVLDELNKALKPDNLFFAPETSTSNRCMIGGMIGNNSCGAHSLLYGSVRDHLLEVKAFLADGSQVVFGDVSKEEFNAKCELQTLEGQIYRKFRDIYKNPENLEEIEKEFPRPDLHRRNNGYAIDLLANSEVTGKSSERFNMCKIIAGSEGTLAFVTEAKLNLLPLPPKNKAVVAAHFNDLFQAFYANLIALKYKPGAIELMDHIILECTKNNLEQNRNRFFIQGEPKALLLIEFERETEDEIKEIAAAMETEMRQNNYGYAYPVIYGNEINKIWALRKAGLGVLSNIVGDAKPVTVIEDTAVHPEDMPNYMKDFHKVLQHFQLSCVHHAHISTGELHLRPVLNLKNPDDVQIFEALGAEIARLVKKYRGTLSGEHGDGRLRGEFIPYMIGEKNYQLILDIKKTFDTKGIFNPGKITNTPGMSESLRYTVGRKEPEIATIFDFSKQLGILRAAENCNGSGDCRKSEGIGGVMCPSFMATHNEMHLTRARANMLREVLTNATKANPFNSKELYQVMDLCLMCKGCKAECPSSVDITKLKAEFLQHYQDANGVSLRTRLIANISSLNKLGTVLPSVYNFFQNNSIVKKIVGLAAERKMPTLQKQTLKQWNKQNHDASIGNKGKVYLFADEYTNFNDTQTGVKAILLLRKLGYEVLIPQPVESARACISKGLIRKAKKVAERNTNYFSGIITENTPLIGIEPSAILSFRDEYPELVTNSLKEKARNLGKNCLLFDEFFMREVAKGNIKTDDFTKETRQIVLHGHCHQKAIATTAASKQMLSFPENYSVTELDSGCCGMAGAFGYEKEHYEFSMKVGEQRLFPAIRKTNESAIIAAPGASCRSQIEHGTGKQAKHPVEVLYEALK